MNLPIPKRLRFGIVVLLHILRALGAEALQPDTETWGATLEQEVIRAVHQGDSKSVENRLRQALAELPSRLGLENPDEVLKRSEAILALCDLHVGPTNAVRISALEHRARMLIDLKQVQSAARLLNLATSLNNQLTEPLEEIAVRISEDIARIHLSAGNPAKALETISQPNFNSSRLRPSEAIRFRSLIAEAYLDLNAQGSEALNRASALLGEIGEFHERNPHGDLIEKAQVLHLMSRSSRMMRAPETALRLAESALEMRVALLRPGHPDIASSLRQLGELNGILGAHSNGIVQLETALPDLRDSFGPTHLEVLSALRHLALFSFWSGRKTETAQWELQLHQAERQLIEETFVSEDEALLRYRIRRMDSMLVPATLDRSGPAGLAIASVRMKGLAAAWAAEQKDLARANFDPKSATDVRNWTESVRQRLVSNRSRMRSGESPLGQSPEELDLEKSLREQGYALGRARRQLALSVGDVSKRLPANSALVDFIDFPEVTTQSNSPIRLAAILYLPGEHPRFIELPENSEIPKRVLRYSEGLRKDRIPASDLLETSRSLRKCLWDPVARHLPAKATNIVLCPVGPLGTISFGSFAREDSLLGEVFSFRYIPSIAQALDTTSGPLRRKTASSFSNADFNWVPPGGKLEEKPWNPIPLTGEEAKDLQRILAQRGWETHSSTGLAFTRKAVLSTRSPGILHFATHGNWFPSVSPYASVPGDREAIRWSMRNSYLVASGANSMVRAVVDNKPRLSGIWMEIPVQGAETEPYPEGYLTAGDLESMDLKDTWLVILNGCSTGLGEFETLEGIYGLQRAVFTAGAQNVLASAWPVRGLISSKLIPQVVGDAVDSGDLRSAFSRRLSEAMRHERVDNLTPLDQVLRRYGPYMLVSKSL
jgi:CHAT domain-containing protein